MTDPVAEVNERLCELLGRPRPSDILASFVAQFVGKRVLITGAAGSIGSALSEAVAKASPASLTLLDLHENSLFQLRQRLGATAPSAPARYVLADVRNQHRIRQALADSSPDIIIHLAAYKHVHLSEELPEEFAAVNVLGTWRLLEESRRAGVAKFVYPSTDKAVNPPSVYGATKRSAELILRAAANAYPDHSITVVRLVNVVGARGGVIETFVRQIVAGLPVTITDASMTRFWITMDDALLLLTSACGRHGAAKTLVLDLGEPVPVITIARRLWEMLRGLDEPFRVDLTGIRPGERLAEELTYPSEALVRSDFPGVMQVSERSLEPLPIDVTSRWVAKITDLVETSDGPRLRRALFDFVNGAVE